MTYKLMTKGKSKYTKATNIYIYIYLKKYFVYNKMIST